jgi:hypothetical protein
MSELTKLKELGVDDYVKRWSKYVSNSPASGSTATAVVGRVPGLNIVVPGFRMPLS